MKTEQAAPPTEPRIVWVFDESEDAFVDHTRGLAIARHALYELNTGAVAAVNAQRDEIPGVPPGMLRIWYERRFGPFEEP